MIWLWLDFCRFDFSLLVPRPNSPLATMTFLKKLYSISTRYKNFIFWTRRTGLPNCKKRFSSRKKYLNYFTMWMKKHAVGKFTRFILMQIQYYLWCLRAIWGFPKNVIFWKIQRKYSLRKNVYTLILIWSWLTNKLFIQCRVYRIYALLILNCI